MTEVIRLRFTDQIPSFVFLSTNFLLQTVIENFDDFNRKNSIIILSENSCYILKSEIQCFSTFLLGSDMITADP
jgi:hypothetical protein